MPIDEQIRQRLYRHVDVLSELIGPRNTQRPSALDAAREYIRRDVESLNLPVHEQPFEAFGRTGLNIELVQTGSDPALPALVIGAHYDTVQASPGADDNTSAVAILMEIVRALAPRQTRRTVRYVFYDCEEPPHFNFGTMGSGAHAQACRKRGEQLMGMVCLESLGYFVRWPPHIPATVRPSQNGRHHRLDVARSMLDVGR